MPNLATNTLWGGGTVPLKFDASYTATRAGASVTYTLTVSIKALPQNNSGGWYFGFPIYVSATANGSSFAWAEGSSTVTEKTFKAAKPNTWESDITYSGSVTLGNLTATGGIPLKLRIKSSNSLSDRDKTFSYNLPVPPAASSIASINDGNPIELNTRAYTFPVVITAYDSNFTHQIDIYPGSSTTSAATRTIDAGVSSYSFVLSATEVGTLRDAFPNSSTASLVFKLTTYSGQTKIGESTAQTTGTIPNTLTPRISGPLSLSPYYPSDSIVPAAMQNLYIQGYVYLRVAKPTASARYGASLEKYVITLTYAEDGSTEIYEVPESSFPENGYDILLTKPGDATASAKVVDSRGNESSSISASVVVAAYESPQVAEYSSVRCDAQGNESVDGTYFQARITGTGYAPGETHTVTIASGSPISSLGHVKHNGATWYSSGDTFTVADGDVLFCYVKNGGSGTDNYIYYNGAPSAIGSPATYTFNVHADVTLDFSIQVPPTETSSGSLQITEDAHNLTYKYSYCESSASNWSTPAVFTLTNGVSGALGGGNISPDSSYNIRYYVYDDIHPDGILLEDYVSSGKYTLFLAKGGNAVSIGEAYTPASSTEKVLNIADDWVINRGSEPAIRNVGGWTVHYLGDGYVEMWGEISEIIDQWTQWSTSDIYFSQYKYHKTYPQISPSQNNVFAAPPVVSATLRTYYTSETNQPSLWLIGDGHDSTNTSDSQKNHTPYYTIGRVGGGITASATICFHVFGKLATS